MLKWKTVLQLLYEWLEENRNRMEEMNKFSSWRDILDEIGGSYERIWSKEELDQGYLNNKKISFPFR